MKIKYYILTLLLLLSGGVLSAQKQWTLQECIDYAIENNISIKQSELNIEAAENELNTSKNRQIPSLSGSINGGLGFGKTRVVGNDGVERYATGETGSLGASLSLSQVIFQGFSIRNSIAVNKLKMESSVADLEYAKESVSLSVVQQFLQVMFAKELEAVTQNQMDLTLSQQERSKAMVESGKSAEAVLFEADALVARDELTLTEAQNSTRETLLNLAQLLNVESINDFDILMPVFDDAMIAKSDKNIDQIYETALDTRPIVTVGRLGVLASEKDIARAKSGYYPSVSLGASLGSGYNYTFGSSGQTTFGNQFRDRFDQSIGLNVSIPIFNRFTTRNQVRGARIQYRYQELTFIATQQKMRKDIEQAYSGAENAYNKYLSAESSARYTQIVMDNEVLKYEAGLSTMYNFNDAKTAYVRSQSELLQAKYQFIFAHKVLDYYSDIPLTFE